MNYHQKLEHSRSLLWILSKVTVILSLQLSQGSEAMHSTSGGSLYYPYVVCIFRNLTAKDFVDQLIFSKIMMKQQVSCFDSQHRMPQCHKVRWGKYQLLNGNRKADFVHACAWDKHLHKILSFTGSSLSILYFEGYCHQRMKMTNVASEVVKPWKCEHNISLIVPSFVLRRRHLLDTLSLRMPVTTSLPVSDSLLVTGSLLVTSGLASQGWHREQVPLGVEDVADGVSVHMIINIKQLFEAQHNHNQQLDYCNSHQSRSVTSLQISQVTSNNLRPKQTSWQLVPRTRKWNEYLMPCTPW